MKRLLLCIIACMLTGYIQAQFYKNLIPATHSSFTDSFAVIVNDYQHNFYHIQGEQLSANADVDIYQSRKTIPGSSEPLLYRYHSTEDTTASWQAILYKGEDYKEAVKAYKNAFRQVKKCQVKINDLPVKFSGEMEEPSPTVRFTVSSLQTENASAAYENFFAEVELTQVYMEWEVKLHLHSKKKDTSTKNY